MISTSRQDSELLGGERIEKSESCGSNRIACVNHGGRHVSCCVHVNTPFIFGGSPGPDCISASSILDDYRTMYVSYRDTGYLAIGIDTFNQAQASRGDCAEEAGIPPIHGVRRRACITHGNLARTLPPGLASSRVCTNFIAIYLVPVINLVSERSKIRPQKLTGGGFRYSNNLCSVRAWISR